MKISSILFSGVVALALSACGGDPLVGKWVGTVGTAPATTTVTITVASDKTFTLVTVGPGQLTATDSTCVYTTTLSGTYVETSTTLTETFTAGTQNAVSGCTTAANNNPGTTLTPALLTAGASSGALPGPATYTVTSTTLTLTQSVSGTSTTTTFTKS